MFWARAVQGAGTFQMSWFNLNLEAFSFALLSILFEGLPFLLLGSIISGVVDVFVSSERVAKFMPKNAVGSIFLSGLMGLVFPICECGSVIVVRRFVRKGLPLGSAVAYMLAAPIVSPIVAISTYKAFTGMSPWLMVSLRLGIGFSVAVIVALVVQRLPKRLILQPSLLAAQPAQRRAGLRIASAPGEENGETPDFATVVAEATTGRKLLLAVQSATSDFLDVAFFFIIGASLASLFIGLRESAIEPLASGHLLPIITLMAVASLLCLCSTTDAFVAANSFREFSLAANVAFLVFGPLFDAKLFWLYGMIFKRRFVLLMAAGMAALVLFICLQIDSVEAWSRKPAPAPAPLPASNSIDSTLALPVK